jgi:hypothetical protein
VTARTVSQHQPHRTIQTSIPDNTPRERLLRLLTRYADPQLPVPSRYRVVMLARIVALLLAAARHDGEQAS